jgi:adenine C2-methylase RlmN of 23S rRNA A2503 and tRNA A37
VRNLTPAEIVGQIMVARDDLGDWAPRKKARSGWCRTSC